MSHDHNTFHRPKKRAKIITDEPSSFSPCLQRTREREIRCRYLTKSHRISIPGKPSSQNKAFKR